MERLVLGGLDTNCWLVADDEGGPLLVIDPADEEAVLLAAIGERPVATIVLTHGHVDHMGAAAAISRATGAPVALHRIEAPRLADPIANLSGMLGCRAVVPEATRLLDDGDDVEAGGLRLRVLHTPGHTPGGICLFADAGLGGERVPRLFSGDTLFARSVGRTDFPGGSARILRDSVARLATLPPETVVHTGHGPDTAIGVESKLNPFFPRV